MAAQRANEGTVAVLMSESLQGRIFSPEDLVRLEELGATHCQDDDVRAMPGDAVGEGTEVIITGWDSPRLTDELLAKARNLRLIGHTGASIRGIVPTTVYNRGVAVTTVAGVLAEGVAEFTIMAIIAGLRRAAGFHERMRNGIPWTGLAAEPPGRLLRGRTVGVVGASRVGRALIELLHAFGCRIVVFDPFMAPSQGVELGVEKASLDELLATSDVVTLHAPELPATRGMIGAAELARMKPGALLVNTARAGLVDEPALLAELRTGRLLGVLDVFHEEPLPETSPWRNLPGVLITPHIAALTQETLHAQGSAVLDEIVRLRAGESLLGEISRELYERMG